MPLYAEDSDPIRSHLLKIGSRFSEESMKPKAILVISAHYETAPSVLVTSSSKPDMYFDYYGFPDEAYKFKYPAPGNPDLANRVQHLLKSSNIPCDLDPKRGFDHGVFVPLMIAFPKADIPVITLSLHKSFDPQLHLKMGEALRPLREEGVLIVGSGMSFHNMRSFMKNNGTPLGYDFDEALNDVITKTDPVHRDQILAEWDKLPGARKAHAREEHFLPLLVVVGAAGSDVGTNDRFSAMKASISGFSFP